MHLANIELSKLIVSPANMRAKRKDRDVADLIPSVRARGVLVPLLVRPNGTPDTYEIVAGRRRYFAAKAVAATNGETMSLPCAIIEPGDDASALEASLIENIARLDPDDVAQWETFARLIKEGRSVDDIAATFGIAEAVVRRVLALGNLLPKLLGLYRTEKIDAGTIRSLTLATTAQQRSWLALYESQDDNAPTGRALKAWLFGGNAIPTSAALFDIELYAAPIVTDLFDEHSYFSDSTQFWSLQTAAIEEKKQAYLTDGWSEVLVLDDGRWFDRWAYEKRAKSKGGRVYIALGEGGAVEIHEGYLPRKEAERRDGAQSNAPRSVRSELTRPLSEYNNLHRHAAVRAALIDYPWLALRLFLAHLIAGWPSWRIHLETQHTDKPETRQSLAASTSEAMFAARRSEAFALLGFPAETRTLLRGGNGAGPAAIFAVLQTLSEAELLELFPIVMGEALEAGSTTIDALGTSLAIDMTAVWQADDAFFTLVRDRQILCALVAEVAGAEASRANCDAPAKVLKAILRDCLTGENGRAKVEAWAPRWLQFPSSLYRADEPVPPEPEYASVDDESNAQADEPTSRAETVDD